MIQSMDIFMIILFLVAVSFIIGLNIVSVVDRKLGTVEINVPPINVPSPTLIVNVNKSNGEIETFVEDNKCKMVKKDPVPKIEGFSGKVEEKQPTKAEPIKINQKTDTGGKSNMSNPDAGDAVVDYGNYICYKKEPVADIKPEQKQVTCGNDYMNEKFKHGSQYTSSFSTCAQKSWDDIDPQLFYKTLYKPRPAVMEDEVLKGYNVNTYESATDIQNIGMIDLKNTNQYPKGNSYIEQHDAKRYV